VRRGVLGALAEGVAEGEFRKTGTKGVYELAEPAARR